MAVYAAHTNKSTPLLTAQTTKKTRATQKKLPFGKKWFRESGQENGPKAEKGESKSDTIRQKNNRGDHYRKVVGIKLTALRFQQGGDIRNPPVSLRGN